MASWYEQLDRLEENDIEALAELDANGLLIAPDEDFISYRNRLCQLREALLAIDKSLSEEGRFMLFDDLPLLREDLIPAEVMAEAVATNEQFYAFRINWVPGFFLSKSLGLLWGGCAISFPENGLSVFLIRAAFRKKARWLIYSRVELLAHELCHVARMPLGDRPLEELFAYRVSGSSLRRYLGNCFQNNYDAILFLLPVILLLVVTMIKTFADWENFAIWPFWLLAGLYPLFLLIRNHFARRSFIRAERALFATGIEQTGPILFRCRSNEIKTISSFLGRPDELLKLLRELAGKELRWRLIMNRFG